MVNELGVCYIGIDCAYSYSLFVCMQRACIATLRSIKLTLRKPSHTCECAPEINHDQFFLSLNDAYPFDVCRLYLFFLLLLLFCISLNKLILKSFAAHADILTDSILRHATTNV